eukprot:355089-Prymnesium_polylepis.1
MVPNRQLKEGGFPEAFRLPRPCSCASEQSLVTLIELKTDAFYNHTCLELLACACNYTGRFEKVDFAQHGHELGRKVRNKKYVRCRHRLTVWFQPTITPALRAHRSRRVVRHLPVR